MSPLSTVPDWPEDPEHDRWASHAAADKILGRDVAGCDTPIPLDWVRVSARRIRDVRDEMRRAWVGFDFGDRGHLTDWVLALMIGRENGLLLGGPGTAKTEIAERAFELFGLTSPTVNQLPTLPRSTDVRQSWEEREAAERRTQKYFSYLLSRFTEPEELFGPIEISLLRRGMLVRVNFGMLTGPGVRAAFLDEVFKASSSILNAMLRLVLNREYFSWGGMRPSDLVTFLAASNELPGGFASGDVTIGASGEDFATLHAFLDRFSIRLDVPVASGSSTESTPEASDLALATRIAIRRERQKIVSNRLFQEPDWTHGRACLNDVLLAGRAVMHQTDQIFPRETLDAFEQKFYRIATTLQQDGTSIRSSRVSWTITPRKLKALWKVALAHALVRDDGFLKGGVIDGPGAQDLVVFNWIWDAPGEARHTLERRVMNML